MSRTYPVKFFNNLMTGAPSIAADSTAGQISDLLIKCLVEGFGELSPSLLEWDDEFNWVKVSFNVPHSYIIDSIVLVEGADQSVYNGEHRIKRVTLDNIWIELDTDAEPALKTATGPITIKMAPLGWELIYTDILRQICVLKPAGDLGNVLLRIDNTEFSGWTGNYGRLCKVAMIEDYLDPDTYSVIYEHRWAATDWYSDLHTWDLVGDNRIFFNIMRYANAERHGGFTAGYIDSIRPDDRYHFIMNRLPSTSATVYWNQSSGNSYDCYPQLAKNISTTYNYMARRYHQLEGTCQWYKRGLATYGSDTMPSPNPVDHGFYLNTQPQMIQEDGNNFRGYMPIMIEPLSNNLALWRRNLQDLPEHPGKIFRMLKTNYDRRMNYADVLVGFDISTVEV